MDQTTGEVARLLRPVVARLEFALTALVIVGAPATTGCAASHASDQRSTAHTRTSFDERPMAPPRQPTEQRVGRDVSICDRPSVLSTFRQVNEDDRWSGTVGAAEHAMWPTDPADPCWSVCAARRNCLNNVSCASQPPALRCLCFVGCGIVAHRRRMECEVCVSATRLGRPPPSASLSTASGAPRTDDAARALCLAWSPRLTTPGPVVPGRRGPLCDALCRPELESCSGLSACSGMSEDEMLLAPPCVLMCDGLRQDIAFRCVECEYCQL